MTQHLVRQFGPRLGLAHRRQQAKHLHRLEHALHVAAAAIVAAEPEPHAGLAQVTDRRNSAFELQVAQVIEHDAGTRLRHAVHLMHDIEARPQQASFFEIGDERAVMIGK